VFCAGIGLVSDRYAWQHALGVACLLASVALGALIVRWFLRPVDAEYRERERV
jgi:hypothetical protein